MNAAPKIIVREWQKPERIFGLRRWSPETGQAFVVDADNRSQVIQLSMPDMLEIGAKFPEWAPLTITGTILLPPPCRSTEQEAASLRVAAADAAFLAAVTNPYERDWELIWLRTHDEILVPAADDDAALKGQFEGFHGWDGSNELAEHERKRRSRDEILQERWAKKHGLNLHEINAHKVSFLIWYLGHWRGLGARPAGTIGLLHVVQPNERIDLNEYRPICAKIRFTATFPAGIRVWLTDCKISDPLPTAVEQQPFESVLSVSVPADKPQESAADTADHLAEMRAAAELIQKAGQQARADMEAGALTVKTLTKELALLNQDSHAAATKAGAKLAGDQALTRDKWAENPLGSRESTVDYLLAMDAAGIQGSRAAALARFGYGATRKKCAAIAGVSEETIKRDLGKARQTPYANFFARTRKQKREAGKALKKPDEAYAWMIQKAKLDPDALHAFCDQMILKVQSGEAGENLWDKTAAGLNEES